MSSTRNECQVTMVRILELNAPDTKTYEENVTVSILWDSARQLMYLRINHNGTRVFGQEFSGLQWVQESSLDDVVTICTSKTTIVIIYDNQDASLVKFFRNLRSLLESKGISSLDSASSTLDPGQLKSRIDQLVQSIKSADSYKAEYIAKELAKLRVNVQFSLSSKNDNEDKNIVQSNAHIQRPSKSLLQLIVCIECFSNEDPIVAPIAVLEGTTLQSLKNQIENKTGIKSTDQYWFAFKQYLIPDDYVFGSPVSFIPNINQRSSLGNSIQSGDTLTMYIARTSSNY